MKVYKFNEMPLNEELLGGLVNFFKGLWKKMGEEITRLENDPNKIKEYIANNTFNVTSPNSIFKMELDTFNKNKVITDDTVKNFINDLLNPTTGVLGKQGIGNLFNDKALQGDKIKAKRIAFEYIINLSRNYISKKINYNPTNNKFDRDGTSGKFIDNNFLKGLKAVMPIKDKIDKKKVINWITINIFQEMQKFVRTIKEDDIKAAQQKGGVDVKQEATMTYDRLKEFLDSGDPVIYLLKDKTKEEFDVKKAPEEQTTVVGIKKIHEVKPEDGDDAVTFLDKNNQPNIKKRYEDIIGPAKAKPGEAGQNAQKAKEALGKIANDEDKMGKVATFADFIGNEANKDKVEQINQIMGGANPATPAAAPAAQA